MKAVQEEKSVLVMINRYLQLPVIILFLSTITTIAIQEKIDLKEITGFIIFARKWDNYMQSFPSYVDAKFAVAFEKTLNNNQLTW